MSSTAIVVPASLTVPSTVFVIPQSNMSITWKIKFLTTYATHHAISNLTGIVKGIDPGQPAQSALADPVKTFRYWQIFCVLSDNSTLLNCHFDIIKLYQPVLASFPFLLFLSTSSDKVPFPVVGHIYQEYQVLPVSF